MVYHGPSLVEPDPSWIDLVFVRFTKVFRGQDRPGQFKIETILCVGTEAPRACSANLAWYSEIVVVSGVRYLSESIPLGIVVRRRGLTPCGSCGLGLPCELSQQLSNA